MLTYLIIYYTLNLALNLFFTYSALKHLKVVNMRELVKRTVGIAGSLGIAWYGTVKGGEHLSSNAVSSLNQTQPISWRDFVTEQESCGIPAQDIVDDMWVDMKQIAKVPLGTSGPSSFGSQPVSGFSDFALKTGHNMRPDITETGALTDPFGTEHLVRGDTPTDGLTIFMGRVSTFLDQLKPKLTPGTTYVSFNAGSLNSYDATKGSTSTVRSIVDTLSDYEMGHTVKAETGIADYRKSWWASRINSNRRGYDKTLVAGLYMNLLVKMFNPGVRTVNINHSWGGPSTIGLTH
jgi:hypothetical protein